MGSGVPREGDAEWGLYKHSRNSPQRQPHQHLPPQPPSSQFLNERIGYLDITRVIEAACDAHRAEHKLTPSLEEIVHFDGWARKYVADNFARIVGGSAAKTVVA